MVRAHGFCNATTCLPLAVKSLLRILEEWPSLHHLHGADTKHARLFVSIAMDITTAIKQLVTGQFGVAQLTSTLNPLGSQLQSI